MKIQKRRNSDPTQFATVYTLGFMPKTRLQTVLDQA